MAIINIYSMRTFQQFLEANDEEENSLETSKIAFANLRNTFTEQIPEINKILNETPDFLRKNVLPLRTETNPHTYHKILQNLIMLVKKVNNDWLNKFLNSLLNQLTRIFPELI